MKDRRKGLQARELRDAAIKHVRRAAGRAAEVAWSLSRKNPLPRLRETRRENSASPRKEPDGPVVVEELLDLAAFSAALAANLPILNEDLPTHIDRLHTDPQACPWVTAAYFQEKVVLNKRRTGRYFAIHDQGAARVRWPGMVTCKVCGKGPLLGSE